MRAGFTEFTYAFALMDELVNHPLRIRGGRKYRTLPIIPSLRAEGQAGGGYDLKLDGFGSGGPLFLQFKVSEYMSRASAKGWRCFGKKFYRFKLWGRKRSNQHQLLLDLEQQQRGSVWYVAPIFHEEPELSRFYRDREITRHSIWVRPRAIGSFHDDSDHYVAHLQGGPVYRFSDPEEIPEGFAFDGEEAVQSLAGDETPLKDSLESALQNMLAIVGEPESALPADRQTQEEAGDSLFSIGPRELIAGMPLAYQVEFLARHYFGCATILVAEEKE